MTKTVAADDIAYEVHFSFETKDHYGEWDIVLTQYGDGFIVMNADMRPIYESFGVINQSFYDIELEYDSPTADDIQAKIEELVEKASESAYESMVARYYG